MATVAVLIMQELARAGVRHFFGVQGGACAHLIQAASLGNTTSFVPVLNEQAAGLYAHGAYKATGQVCGAIVTTGPGFFNLVTGIAACFYDRVPAVFLCGQINARGNLADQFGTRMYGFQEADHAAIANHIAEYSIRVTDSASLSRALTVIRTNAQCPGPIFIEIQDDLQRQPSEALIGILNVSSGQPPLFSNPAAVTETSAALTSARHPLFVVGAGVSPHAFDRLDGVSRRLSIPILFSWAAHALVDPHASMHQGFFGNHSPGRGNDLLREADLVIALGTSLLQHQVSNDKSRFAPAARVLFINNDYAECARFATDFSPRGTGFHASCEEFLSELPLALPTTASYWPGRLWQATGDAAKDLPHVNQAVEALRDVLAACPADFAVFSDAGATLSWTYQAANLVTGPPVFTSFNLHTMGYAIPASVGAAAVSGKGTLSLSGDGGFMMNLQELAQARSRGVKTVVLDNRGYGIIRQTQDDFLDGQHCGSSFTHPKSPLPPYDVQSLISAFGIPCRRCGTDELKGNLVWLFEDSEARALVIDVDSSLKVEGVGL